MKANVKGNVFVTKDVVKAEIKKYTKEHYDTIAADVAVQFAALVLCVLDKDYGWRKKRLRAFTEHFKEFSAFVDMGKILGNQIDTWTCVEYIKDKYNIDLEEIING